MKLYSNIFFTSDLHIGHRNVIEFDKRPFRDLDHMHETLIANYNASVKHEDTCFFLGDIALGRSSDVEMVIAKLQGTKVLILGNHDKGSSAMKRMGFDVILNTASLVIAGRIVTLSHCPLRGVYRESVEAMKGAQPGEHWHGELRHSKYSLEDFGQFHLHGHTHKGPEERILGRQWDVGVRANSFRPVSISQVEKWINNTLQKEIK